MEVAGIEQVEGAFATLERLLQANAGRFAKVGGDVAFYVKDARPPHWQVTSVGGMVVVRPGNPPFPVVTIGIVPQALAWLVEGTLDVAKAFRKKRLAVEGDFEALARFVECFNVQ